MVLGGSVVMIFGALAISTAVAGEREHHSRNLAIERECDRYGLDYFSVIAAQTGSEFDTHERRRRWGSVIVAAGVAFFLWLGVQARVPEIAMNRGWLLTLVILLAASLL